MIYSLKKWDDPDTYYTQENNPAEEMLRKSAGKGFLESCGPTTAVNLIAATGNDVRVTCVGIYQPQPEQVLMSAFNDPANYKEFIKIRNDIDPANFFNNRVPQFYPYLLNLIFDINSIFEWKTLDGITNHLSNNIGLMVCLKKPGHYIGIVAYDDDNGMVCYRDPWQNNYWPTSLRGKPGFNRWIDVNELQDNLAGYRVLVNV